MQHIPPKTALRKALRSLERDCAARFDNFGYGLRGIQVELAVQVGSPREFAGFGGAKPARIKQCEYAPDNQRVAVAADLEAVFAGKRGAPVKARENDVVYTFIAVDEYAIVGFARTKLRRDLICFSGETVAEPVKDVAA